MVMKKKEHKYTAQQTSLYYAIDVAVALATSAQKRINNGCICTPHSAAHSPETRAKTKQPHSLESGSVYK
jgi:hypothetical protein